MNSELFSFNVERFHLQGVINWPEKDSKSGAMILHPHPLFGGTSEDHVVRFLERILLAHGYTTLRFDFRGTHTYPWKYAGVLGAVEDGLAASQALLDYTGMQSHAILGYSFGGSVALLLASRIKTDFLVTLSASLELTQEFDVGLNSLEEVSCPTMMFHGDRDSMVPFRHLNQLARKIPPAYLKTYTIEGGGHFYMDPAKKQVQDQLLTFLKERTKG